MKALRAVLLVLLVLSLGLLTLGFFLPQRATVSRSVDIECPPAVVFTVLNGFRHFPQWSPWAALDPQMQTAVEGPVQGVGARYRWSSEQGAVGNGSLEIVESVPYTRIAMRLDFAGDIQQSRYVLAPQGRGTRLTWEFEADFSDDFFSRYFGLLLDRLVGADYERGLAALKAHVETLPAVDFSALDVQVLDVSAEPLAYVSGSSSTDPAAIAAAYTRAFERLSAALAGAGIKPAGPVRVIGRVWDERAGRYEFEAAVPVARDARMPPSAGLRSGEGYAGTALRALHHGGEDHLQQLVAYKRAVGYQDNGAPWDVYAATGGRATETFVPVK